MSLTFEHKEGINSLFEIPIITKTINKNSLDTIKSQTKEYISKNKDKFGYAWPCPTLSDIQKGNRHSFDSKELINEIKIASESYSQAFKFKTPQLSIREFWVNVAPKGAYQEGHVHIDPARKIIFSGVLYLDPPKNCGSFRISNPNKISMMHLLDCPQAKDVIIEPKDGLMIMFPAWMRHEALINPSEQERISISWNIKAILQ
jgi:uncharacterized protein (TIGR02466 family)